MFVDVMVFVPDVSVDEGAGMVQVCVTLLSVEPIERDFTVTLATDNHTGINGVCITLWKASLQDSSPLPPCQYAEV